jgi:hypothetical protein
MALDSSALLGSPQVAGTKVNPRGLARKTTSQQATGLIQSSPQLRDQTPNIGRLAYLAVTSTELALITIGGTFTAKLGDVIARVARNDVTSINLGNGYVEALVITLADGGTWQLEVPTVSRRAAQEVVRVLDGRAGAPRLLAAIVGPSLLLSAQLLPCSSIAEHSDNPVRLDPEVRMRVRWRTPGPRRSLVAMEWDRQGGHDEGREKDRQKPLFAASEGDDLALGRVEGRNSARVSAVAELQGVTSGFDWRLDGLVCADRRGGRAVDQDVEFAATDLHADEVSRQLDRCRHLGGPFGWFRALLQGKAKLPEPALP